MSKYNLKELEEKLERCRNIKLEGVTLDDVDEIISIKIDRRNLVTKEFRFYCESKESLYI